MGTQMWLRIKYDNIMQNDNCSSELPKARSLHSLYNETIVHMDIKLHMNLLTIFSELCQDTLVVALFPGSTSQLFCTA